MLRRGPNEMPPDVSDRSPEPLVITDPVSVPSMKTWVVVLGVYPEPVTCTPSPPNATLGVTVSVVLVVNVVRAIRRLVLPRATTGCVPLKSEGRGTPMLAEPAAFVPIPTQ